MKAWKIMRFQLISARKSFLLFYLIYMVVVTIVCTFSSSIKESSSSGTDLSSSIYLFVVGLCSFREAFFFSQGMGVSRKSFFKGTLLSFLPLCLATTALDFAILRMQALFMPSSTFYELVFYAPAENEAWAAGREIGGILSGLLWSLLLHLALMLFGFFLTQIYYRSSNWMKVAVSVGLFIFVNIWHLPWLYPVLQPVIWFVSDGLRCCLFFAVLSGIFAGGAWLLTRRACVKRG